jgi:hypothetical protein
VKLNLLGRKGIALLFLVLMALLPKAALMAWSEHPLISRPVIASIPEVRDAKTVPVESLDAFIRAEGKRLERLLSE